MNEDQPIDAGEELLARTGIGHALSRSTKPLWLRKTATPLEESIAEKCKAFISGEPAPLESALPELDYEKVLDQLVKAKTQEPAHEGFEKLDDDTISGYLVAVQRAIDYLDKVIPRVTTKDLIGTRALEPSDLQLSKFRRVWAVAQDPMVTLKALTQGTLVKDQAIAFQVMFPGMYAAAKTAIWDAIIEERAGNQKWTLPYTKDNLLQTFLLVTTGDDAAIKRLQQNYADEKARQGQKTDQPSSPPGSKVALATETPIQRAAT